MRTKSLGVPSNPTNSQATGNSSCRRRQTLLAAAAGAVAFFGIASPLTRADVLENQYGATSDVNLGNAADWLDLSSPSVDSPAKSGSFAPTGQDIAQFDPDTGLFVNPATFQPTFTLQQTGSTTWAGLVVNSPGALQYQNGTFILPLQLVISGGSAGQTLNLGNTKSTGSLPNSGELSVFGDNSLILQSPLSVLNSQTWSAGIINGTNLSGTNVAVNVPAISINGAMKLAGNLTITGASDLTSGNIAIAGNISDGASPGGIIMNSAVGTLALTNGTSTATTFSAGTLTLTGTNTFTGGITLKSGEVDVTSESNLGGNGAPSAITFSGGVLGITGSAIANLNSNSINGFAASAGSVWNNVPLKLNVNNGPASSVGGLSVSVAANGGLGSLTITQQLTGSSSINKFGSGTLIVANPANNFTGGTTLSAGNLVIPDFTYLGTHPNVVNTLGTAGTVVVTGPSVTVTGSAAGFGGLIGAGTTLTVNSTGGTLTNTSLGVTNNSNLVLDYSTSANQILGQLPNTNGTLGPITGTTLLMQGGTFSLVPNATSTPRTPFAGLQIQSGANLISSTGPAVNLGFYNYTTAGTSVVTGGTLTTTNVVSNTTVFRNPQGATGTASGYGAVVEFTGPVTGTVTPFQVANNSPQTGNANLTYSAASLLSAPSPFNSGTIGTVAVNTRTSTTTTSITATSYTGYYSGDATYGLSDWAVVTAPVGGTSYIAPASSVSGFYTVINGSPVTLAKQAANGPDNVDIENPGEVIFPANSTITSIRFNGPNGGLVNLSGNDVDQLLLQPGDATAALLFTPNIGANTVLISNFGTATAGLTSINTADLAAGKSGTAQDAVFWQNNTLGLVVLTTGVADAGAGSPAFGGLTKAGPGVLVLDATSSYTGQTTIDGGAIEIPFASAIGAISTSTTGGTNMQAALLNTLTLNGGGLVATNSFALDNGGTGNGFFARNVVVAPAGGNLSALGGDTLTIDGNISGSGNLTLGNSSLISTATANSSNAAVSIGTTKGIGTVILSGVNTYTGSTTVAGGTAQLDGSFASTNFVAASSGTLAGKPTFLNPVTVTVNNGGNFYPGDTGIGGMSVANLALNGGSTLSFALDGSAQFAANQINVTNQFTAPESTTSLASAVNLQTFEELTTKSFATPGQYLLFTVPTSSAYFTNFAADNFNNGTLSAPTSSTLESFNVVDGFALANPAGATIYSLSATNAGSNVGDIVLTISSVGTGGSSEWAASAGGSWQNPNNWIGPVPDNSGNRAVLDSAPPGINTPSTITLDGTVLTSFVDFNSANAYTIVPGTGGNSPSLNGFFGLQSIEVDKGNHLITAPISLSADLFVQVNNAGDSVTLSGPISGNNNLYFVPGNGTLILAASNTYTGTTTFMSSGALQLGNGVSAGTLGNTQPFAIPSGTLVFDAPSGVTQNFINTITGTGGLSQIGTGSEVILTGDNTQFTGPITIGNGAALKIGTAVASGLVGLVTDNGLLDVNGIDTAFGNLSGHGVIDNLGGGSPNLLIGIASVGSTFTGVIKNTTGTVSLTKAGSGTLALLGANTYSGPTTIENFGGYLAFAAAQPLPASDVIYNLNTDPSRQGGALIVTDGVTLANPIVQTVGAATFIQIPSGNALLSGPITMPTGGANQYRLGTNSADGTLTLTNISANGPDTTIVDLYANSTTIIDLGNIVFAQHGALLTNSSVTTPPDFGLGSDIIDAGTVGLNLTFAGDSGFFNFGPGGVSVGGGSDSPFVNVTIQDRAQIYLGAGTYDLDTTTVGGITNTLNLNGGTLTTGSITYAPGSGTAATSTAIINFNGGVLVAGAASANFLPTQTSSNIVYNINDGGAIIDSSGFNIVNNSPEGFLTAGSGTLKIDGVSVPDGGLTKNGVGQLVFTSLAGINTYGGPTVVNGGLLEFGASRQVAATAWIQVAAGGAVGAESGTLTDPSFNGLLGGVPSNIHQAGAVAISPLDNAVVIDFSGAISGEGPGLTNIGGTNYFNMTNVAGLDSGSASLANMSIGALSGVGQNGKGSELAAISFAGSIIPGANSTYQLGGGGTLDLVKVTTGPMSANGGDPLVNYLGQTTNLLAENGGAVELPTTNTYTGTTTIQGAIVTGVPAADIMAANPNVPNLPIPAGTMLEQTILAVTHLADTNSSIGLSSNAASNLIINGGDLQYIGAGDHSTRLFTIGALGATLDGSGTGAVVFSNSNAYSFSAGITAPLSLTLQGTYGTDNSTAGSVNILAGSLSDGGASAPLSLIKSGTGVWAVSNANNSYTGGTTVNGGILAVNGPSAKFSGTGTGVLGSTAGPLAVNTGATLDLENNSVTVGALSGAGVVDDISGGGTPNLSVGNGGGTGTFSGVIQNTSGVVSLTVAGGTEVLSGNSTFTGATAINVGGTLQVGVRGTSGAVGPAAITDNGSLIISRSDTTLTFLNNITGSGSVTSTGPGTVTFGGVNTYAGGTTILGGVVRPGGSSSITSLGTGTVTDSSVLDLNGLSLTIGGLAGAGTVDNVSGGLTPVLTVGNAATPATQTTTFSGVITNTTGVVSLVQAAGTLVLTGANTFGGGSTITGTLQIGNGGATGSVTGPIVDKGVFVSNLAGTSTLTNTITGAGKVTVAGGTVTFAPTGVNSYAGGTTIASGASVIIPAVAGLPSNAPVVNNGTLTINAGTSATPVIIGNPAAGTGDLTGTGVLNDNGYVQLASIGATTVVSSSVTTLSGLNIGAGSTLDITNNQLLVTYTGADPLSALRSALHTSYIGASGPFTGTGLTSSTVAAEDATAKGTTKGVWSIGFIDGSKDGAVATANHVAANQFLIEPILSGDGNLDGQVNFSDLVIIAQNFGSTTADWAHADFNYDSIVNFNDLVLLAQNFGKTNGNTLLSSELPANFQAQWNLALAEVAASGGTSSVPEPGTMSLLGIGAAGLLARRRRRTNH